MVNPRKLNTCTFYKYLTGQVRQVYRPNRATARRNLLTVEMLEIAIPASLSCLYSDTIPSHSRQLSNDVLSTFPTLFTTVDRPVMLTHRTISASCPYRKRLLTDPPCQRYNKSRPAAEVYRPTIPTVPNVGAPRRRQPLAALFRRLNPPPSSRL